MHILKSGAIAALSLVTCSSWAATSCDEVKSAIEAKLHTKGVKAYSLSVVVADAVGEGKVVGNCEGNAKRIVYERGGTPAEPVKPASTAE